MGTENSSELSRVNAVLTVYDALWPLTMEERQWVVKTVLGRLGITSSSSAGAYAQHRPSNRAEAIDVPLLDKGTELSNLTTKQFMATKDPKSEMQRLVCLAFYLARAKGQSEFKTSDLTKLNNDVGGEHLSNPSMVVSNATRQGKYFAPCRGGKKRITLRGERLVEALPDQDKVNALLAEVRKSRRKRTRLATKASK